jgi:quercetin dioxygenase-like cupin family protein
LSGELKLKLGGKDEMDAKAGTFVHMAPNLAHGLAARTACTVLLTLIKGGAAA